MSNPDPQVPDTDEPAAEAVSETGPATVDSLARRANALEKDLRFAHKNALKLTRQLHRSLMRDVRAAEKRAAQAESRATAAEREAARATKSAVASQRRAERARAEVEMMKHSNTWRAGRIVVAVPSKLKRMGRS